MFDTYVTVVGNVLTAPEWRRTSQSNTLVANFKVASTARRLDKDSGRWVDGKGLRVRVTCWRRLAEGVAASVMVGDPIMVTGRMYTRDWTDEAGTHRTLYEVEAVAVGHDLSRGRARFSRNRPNLTTSVVEDDEAEARVRGEASEPVPPDDAPAQPGDVPADADDDGFLDLPMATRDDHHPAVDSGFDAPDFPYQPADDVEPPDVEAPAGSDSADPDSGASGVESATPDPLALGGDEVRVTSGSRGRRGRARAAVPA
ncbi:single-stranded DNA-binding protein [Plantactinospora sp. GCM10030261]|uniref:single-stranded DNA-binding protein n=1 Tax=Plantactinospora sp. GCM10030261 TaxID=3273420 RepID=UPI003617C101